MRLLPFLVLGLLVLSDAAPATRLEAVPEPGDTVPGTLATDPLVLRIQKALGDEGSYDGPIDGLYGPATRAAVAAYRRRAGMPDGALDEDLARHIETAAEVRRLLTRLRRARSANIESARAALLANPATRHLLDDSNGTPEAADPTRDPTPCFRSPTPACLLAEAAESSKAVADDERRFWALGELLVAQAKAGLSSEAMATLRRIGDPRLVMRALGDIALARAEAARLDEALAAAEIIPDPRRKAETLVAIARVAAPKSARAATRARAALAKINDPEQRVALLAELAVGRMRNGDSTAARRHLDTAESIARRPENRDFRDAALRLVAAAHAEAGNAEHALALLDGMPHDERHASVLIAAATAQADAGRVDAAMRTAASIETRRYLPDVLSRIAVAQARSGDMASAAATLSHADAGIDAIDFPYARAYAAARVARSMIDILRLPRPFPVESILAAATRIDDPRLRTETLWSLTMVLERRGNGDGAAAARTAAEAAGRDIRGRLARIWMLAGIAHAWMTEGNPAEARETFDRALAVAEGLRNAWARTRALAKLSTALVDIQ